MRRVHRDVALAQGHMARRPLAIDRPPVTVEQTLMRRSDVTVGCLIAATVATLLPTHNANAQDADPVPAKRDTAAYTNMMAGEFTPATGFDIIRTPRGSLNVSMYGVFRYVAQTPHSQTFTDHLGRERRVATRNDINWHRTMVWLTGFFHKPAFRYNITLWALPTTDQTLLFGNLQYRAAKWLGVGVGVAPNLTARSMQGSFPFWAAADRQMSEEFFRGGFSSGFWMTGEALPRLVYNVTIANNLSQLGVPQSFDTRDMAYSASLRWQPTTGEFGPRNGFGDLEHHTRLATQFGLSAGTSRESRYAALGESPRATQIKLSDGINPFDEGALRDSVTVESLEYRELALDAGIKYRGFHLQSEYFFRRLGDFRATGALPLTSIDDHGWMAEASYMVIPQTLGLHLVGGYIFDDFERNPWEFGGGANYYPSGTRSWRLNAHLLYVNKSPASSLFGYYISGHTGRIFSLAIDILL
jgi:hypothetical protein